MAITALESVRSLASLLNPTQLQNSKSRFKFDLVKRADALRGRTVAKNNTEDALHSRMKFAMAENASVNDLERFIDGNDLMSINYLERGMIAARSVGHVMVRDTTGDLVAHGTGFMISGRLMITNNHVLDTRESAEHSQMEFNYQMDLMGRPMETELFGLRPDEFFYTNQQLDFTVVAVEEKSVRGTDLSQFGFLPLIGQSGKVLEGEYVTCIEHPGAEYKQVALRENQIVDKQEDFIWYRTDTAPGASGAPIFNDSWQVVALHHSGVPVEKNGKLQTLDGKDWSPNMGEDKIAWKANEGVRISSIVTKLQSDCGQEPLIQTAFAGSSSRVVEIRAAASKLPTTPANGLQGLRAHSVPPVSMPLPTAVTPAVPKTVDITIPVRLRINIGSDGVVSTEQTTTAEVAEKVVTRKGYDENFLRTKLPVPALTEAVRDDVLDFNGSPLVPYTHFTLCLSKSRRMARFVAWNINGEQLKKYGRAGLRFKFDPRIGEEFQIGEEAYRNNQLDQGHLARRADLIWGPAAEAKQANTDSFFFTNITPQHQSFNQSPKHGLWGELEDAIFDELAVDGLRVSVMAGPILKDTDPKYRDIQIPRDFWKVLAYVDGEDGLVKAKAFVLTQNDLLNDLEAFALDEFRLYQVSIAELQDLTRLSFGELVNADTFTPEMRKEVTRVSGKRDVREVSSRDDLIA